MPGTPFAQFSDTGALRFPQSPGTRGALADGFVLRAAETRDISGLTALANQPLYRWGTMRLPFQSEEETMRWRGEGGDAAAPTLVVEQDGLIVAVGGLQRMKGRRAHVASLGMGVHDAYHRRGIGAALIEALLDTAFNWLQVRRVELTVFTDNSGAMALYARYGFKSEGILRAYAFRDGAYVDVQTMALLSPVLTARQAGTP